jgi:phosphoserine aminotransferase
MARVFNFSAGPSVLPEESITRSRSGYAGLQRDWNVGHGDVPQIQSIYSDH